MYPAGEDVDGPAIPAGLTLAPIPRRILGLVIDQVVIVLPVIAVAIGFGYTPGDDISTNALLVFNISVAVLGLSYETLMIGAFSRTLGKLATRTRVVRAVDGGRVGWPEALLRALVPTALGVVPQVGVALGAMVYIWALFNPLRQGLHDRAAATLVVRERRVKSFRRPAMDEQPVG